jgi:hypothetical protein
MRSKVFFIGENSIAVRRPNARRKTNRLGSAALSFSLTLWGQSPKPKAEARNAERLVSRFVFGFRASFGSRISTFGFMLPQRLACLFGAALPVWRGALIFADTTPKAGLRFVESHWKRFSNQWRR